MATAALLLTACESDDAAPAADAANAEVGTEGTADEVTDGAETNAPPATGIPGTLVNFDLASEALMDAPWPTDLRRDPVTGRLDLTGFPNPGQIDLLGRYIASAEDNLDGWGITSAAYFTFASAIDPATLPDAKASTQGTASVMVVNLDEDSGAFGELIPADSTWIGTEGYQYVPDNTLIVQPFYGRALRGGTTYGVVVFRSVMDAEGKALGQPQVVAAGLADQGPLADLYAPLREWLARARIEHGDVAAATVFTTGQPTKELKDIATWVDDDAPAPALVDVAVSEDNVSGFELVEGHYTSSNLQAGVVPYDEEGGAFVIGAAGPEVQATESLRFALAVPSGEAPAAGWPVVLYGHGTGGDYKSMLTGSKYSVAKELTKRGMAVMGIDQPLHGPRAPEGTNTDVASFNVFNPEAFRCNFRQSAVDVLFQARFVAEVGTVAGAGVSVKLDPNNIHFLGHSHGGLSGALLAPFAERIRSFVLSGAGGGIAYTIRLRKDPADFKLLVETLLQISDPNELIIGHPVLALVQALVETTDPLAYARHFRNPPGDRPPLDLLLTSGVDDAQTPAVTALNLASTAAMPILAPGPLPSPGHDSQSIAIVATPLEGNMLNAFGKGTMAVAQFADADHFAIFDDERAGPLYLGFLNSAQKADPPVLK
ncbi:MAG: hypothetical protein IV100_09010 [Myxococcales bacterium]|nr:hypothetical protein [Myxococcales bacterium]